MPSLKKVVTSPRTDQAVPGLLIVARDQPALYRALQQTFGESQEASSFHKPVPIQTTRRLQSNPAVGQASQRQRGRRGKRGQFRAGCRLCRKPMQKDTLHSMRGTTRIKWQATERLGVKSWNDYRR